MSLIDDLPTLKEMEQEATSRKWGVEDSDGGHEIRMGDAIESPGQYDSHLVIEYNHGCDPIREEDQFIEAEANAYLIASLRNAAPAMLAVLDCFEKGDDAVLEVIIEIINNLPNTAKDSIGMECLMRLQKAASLMEGRR